MPEHYNDILEREYRKWLYSYHVYIMVNISRYKGFWYDVKRVTSEREIHGRGYRIYEVKAYNSHDAIAKVIMGEGTLVWSSSDKL